MYIPPFEAHAIKIFPLILLETHFQSAINSDVKIHVLPESDEV